MDSLMFLMYCKASSSHLLSNNTFNTIHDGTVEVGKPFHGFLFHSDNFFQEMLQIYHNTMWKLKNQVTKCYPHWGLNPGLWLTSDSKSNTLLSELILGDL